MATRRIPYGKFSYLVANVEMLSSKYGVGQVKVAEILEDGVESVEELANLDFKDLDAIVQEGLAELGR